MKRILLILTAALVGCTGPSPSHPTPSKLPPNATDPDQAATMLVQNHAPAGISDLARMELLHNEMREANLAPSYTWAATPKGDGYEVSVTLTCPDRPPLVFTWQADVAKGTCVASNAEAAKLERTKFKMVHDGLTNSWLEATPAATP